MGEPSSEGPSQDGSRPLGAAPAAPERAGATGRPAAGADAVPQSAADRRASLPVRRIQPPRDVVRSIDCPTCGARAGSLCQRKRGGDRKANHFARVELATELRLGRRLVLPDMGARSSATAVQSRGAVSLDGSAATDTIAPGRDSTPR
jgi:hypothetical protein